VPEKSGSPPSQIAAGDSILTSDAAIGLAVAQDPTLASAVQYLEAHGFRSADKGARDWCTKQAESGVAGAQFALGVMLSLGFFGEIDDLAAHRWFQTSADQGHPAALMMLVGYVECGFDGAPPDPQQAASMIRAAAEMGYAPAMVSMAGDLLDKICGETDRDRAIEYLRCAAKLGDRQGQYLLATNLLKEHDAELVKEGVDWLHVAAANGYAGAHRHLGYLLSSGSHGLRLDMEAADHHFSMATEIEDSAIAEIKRFTGENPSIFKDP
jgi:TPR repeat protein